MNNISFKQKLPDIALAVLTGVILLLSTPGFDLWPLAFAGFALLAWIFERGRLKWYTTAMIIGLIYYGIGISWIHVPVTFFGGAPMPAGIALVVFTGIIGGLFWMPYTYVAGKLKLPFAGALIFVAMEMIKGKYLFGGLPWLNIAQTQYNNLFAVQLVSVLGEHGLSFCVVLAGWLIYLVIKDRSKDKIIALAGVLILIFGFGALRHILYKTPAPTYTGRIVQTGVDQADKWDRSKREEILNTLLSRAVAAAGNPASYDILILPETSFTSSPFRNPEVFSVVRTISAEHPIILSYDRVTLLDGEKRLYNSTALVENGMVVQNYDKMKLAPFGEYFPFEKQLYPLRKFFFGDSTLFSPGTTPTIFEYKELKIIPLICFEGAFSEIIRERVQMGGNVVFLVSNDSWFGKSLGRVQNLAITMIRAAEYNRYILRATQDGISALIGPDGSIKEKFDEKVFEYKDVSFAPLDKLTLFAKFGYIWYVLCIFVYAVYLLKRRKEKKAA